MFSNQASDNVDEVVGCSSSSFSVKLTEVVAKVRNDDGDEVDSKTVSLKHIPRFLIDGIQVMNVDVKCSALS